MVKKKQVNKNVWIEIKMENKHIKCCFDTKGGPCHFDTEGGREKANSLCPLKEDGDGERLGIIEHFERA